jgi:hypothetical protein
MTYAQGSRNALDSGTSLSQSDEQVMAEGVWQEAGWTTRVR